MTIIDSDEKFLSLGELEVFRVRALKLDNTTQRVAFLFESFPNLKFTTTAVYNILHGLNLLTTSGRTDKKTVAAIVTRDLVNIRGILQKEKHPTDYSCGIYSMKASPDPVDQFSLTRTVSEKIAEYYHNIASYVVPKRKLSISASSSQSKKPKICASSKTKLDSDDRKCHYCETVGIVNAVKWRKWKELTCCNRCAMEFRNAAKRESKKNVSMKTGKNIHLNDSSLSPTVEVKNPIEPSKPISTEAPSERTNFIEISPRNEPSLQLIKWQSTRDFVLFELPCKYVFVPQNGTRSCLQRRGYLYENFICLGTYYVSESQHSLEDCLRNINEVLNRTHPDKLSGKNLNDWVTKEDFETAKYARKLIDEQFRGENWNKYLDLIYLYKTCRLSNKQFADSLYKLFPNNARPVIK